MTICYCVWVRDDHLAWWTDLRLGIVLGVAMALGITVHNEEPHHIAANTGTVRKLGEQGPKE